MKMPACAVLAALAATIPFASARQADTHRTEFPMPNGTLTVTWGQPSATPPGPAPTFAQLDTNHDGFVERNEADAYPLLANDFNYADLNHDGRLSKHEYERWVSQP